jgi:hypothetical protein
MLLRQRSRKPAGAVGKADAAARMSGGKEGVHMKTLVTFIAAAAILLTAGLQVFAGEGRIGDEPEQVLPYVLIK